MGSGSEQLVGWLRAAGEPSRLRLLALCGHRDWSVSDLAQALRQSEPRVSRHLRILCEAGLLERLRQGQWVHYRLSPSPRAMSFVQGLFAQLDRGDPQLARDLIRVEGLQGSGRATDGGQTFESRLGRALQGFMDAQLPAVERRAVLVVGVEHLEVLESAASLATQCVAIAHSRRAAQGARAFAERRGFNCRVLLNAAANGLSERDSARAGTSFDLIVLDHLALAGTELPTMLSVCRRALSAGGRLLLFERYESLERARERIVEHPLARLRRLLGEQDLGCERLSPLEADGEHVLAAIAAPLLQEEQTNLRRA